MHRLFLATFTGTVLLLGSVIAGVGYWVDPFGFFSPPDPNFRRDSAYTLNRSLFRTVEFRKLADEMAAQNKQINVIIGDSIGNQIDSVPVEEVTGEVWFNYSYGQATMAENVSLLRDLIEGDYPIKRIVWSLAFNRIRDGGKNEMDRSLQFVDHPTGHLFTFELLRGVYYRAAPQLVRHQVRRPPVRHGAGRAGRLHDRAVADGSEGHDLAGGDAGDGRRARA